MAGVKALGGRLWARLGRLGYGADYNPEQWDEATWAEDAKLMREAGVNIVSLGIFAWASIQPGPGRFEPAWLDRVMDLLVNNGVSVCLATATASPPPWLIEAHPEILPVDEGGHTLWQGSRQHFCPSSPAFKEAASELVERLAERYAKHPALAAWHVGNEYGCHVARCYCDISAGDFRRWLQERYGDLDRLNEAWWTAFWSQRYSSWAQVIPPRRAPTFPNPTQQLDFFRFSNEALLACYLNEAAILRRATPEVPITTNMLPFWEPVDAFAWAGAVDIASLDSYPDPANENAACSAALSFGLMRGVNPGEPWLLMEQAPSAVNWREVNRPKPPGLYRLWTWQAIAHGANGALSFQWRASRGGAEKWHTAMVPHGGAENIIHRQIAEVGRELAALPRIATTRPSRGEVAIVFDWPSWWALELPSRPSSEVKLLRLVAAYHRALWLRGVTVDLVPVTAQLEPYRLVVVPNLYLADEGTARRFTGFVESGGHLIVGFFSGVVDTNDAVYPGSYPGAFRYLLGVEVDQFWPLANGESIGIRLVSGKQGAGTLWSEEMRPTDASVEGTFASGALHGRPAITAATRGNGKAWYVGTLPDEGTLGTLLSDVCRSAGVSPLLPGLPEGVEAQKRAGPDQELLFLLNHANHRSAPTVPPGWEALLGPAPRGGRVDLGAQEVAVLWRSTTQQGGNK